MCTHLNSTEVRARLFYQLKLPLNNTRAMRENDKRALLKGGGIGRGINAFDIFFLIAPFLVTLKLDNSFGVSSYLDPHLSMAAFGRGVPSFNFNAPGPLILV